MLPVLAFAGKALAVWAINMAVGTAAELLSRKPKLRKQKEVQRNLADPATPIPVIYGTQRVGIIRSFVATTGLVSGDTRFLWVAGAVCHGPIAGIDEIYLDGLLAVDATGAAVGSSDKRKDFTQHVTAWKAYGTEGQLMYHPRTAPVTITEHGKYDENQRYVQFSGSHSYVVGDTVAISGTTGIDDHAYFVTAVVSTSQIRIGYLNGGASSTYTGLSGACDYYNPDLPTELSGKWFEWTRGQGLAWVLLRLVYDETRFPNGMPHIEVVVRGQAVEDPRAPIPTTITTSAVSGSGVPRHASAGLFTTSAAHGLVAGDTVQLVGHSVATANGTHRIFDVPSTTSFRLPMALSAAGTGGTVRKLAYSTTPALCIRDFLTNPVFGADAEDAEINDTAFGAEADYHEETVDGPLANTETFSNQQDVTQIVVVAGVATVTTDGNHGYSTSQRCRISGFADAAGGALEGTYTITVTAVDKFTYPTAVADGTYLPDQRRVRPHNVRDREEEPPPTAVGKAIIVTGVTRFTCNGVVDTSQTVQTTIEDLLTSCRGMLVYQGGQFRLTTPRPATPLADFALTDDTIVGDFTLTLPGQDDAANVVTATFPNVAAGYQLDTVQYPPTNEPNGLLEADNLQWLRKEVDLPFTVDGGTAQRIAMALRNESRATMISCLAMEAALVAQVGDVVNVTRSTFGLSAAPYRIVAMAIRPDALVEITAVEHNDAWYTLDPQDDVVYYPDTTTSVAVAPPTALVLTTDGSAGNGGANIVASWTASIDGTVTSYQVEAKRSSLTVWSFGGVAAAPSTKVEIPMVDVTVNHDVRVRAVTADGRKSDWLTTTGYTPDTAEAKIRDHRRASMASVAGVGTFQSANPVSYTISSATQAYIQIADHTLNVPTAVGGYTAISYPGGSISVAGTADRGVPLYAYTDDADFTGTGLTYQYTTNPAVLAQSSARYYMGKVTIPSTSSGSGSGSGGSTPKV